MMRFHLDSLMSDSGSDTDSESEAAEFGTADIPQLLVTSPSDGDLYVGEGNSSLTHRSIIGACDSTSRASFEKSRNMNKREVTLMSSHASDCFALELSGKVVIRLVR